MDNSGYADLQHIIAQRNSNRRGKNEGKENSSNNSDNHCINCLQPKTTPGFFCNASCQKSFQLLN
jgi:hypothetical protein